MGRALASAVPAFASLAAGYQGINTVFACARKFGDERGCLLGGYFWLMAAALFVVVWVVLQAALERWRRGKSGPGGQGGAEAA